MNDFKKAFSGTSSSHECFDKKLFYTATLPVLTMIALLGVGVVVGVPYLTNQYALEKDYAQVGGKENYQTVLEYQAKQASEQIKAMKSGETSQADTQTEPEYALTLSQDQIKEMRLGHVVNGATNSDILLVEYTDPECPFCKRQYDDKTIENALKTEGVGAISALLKPVTGVKHPNTIEKGLGLICAGKIGGYEAFSKLEKALFTDMKVSLSDAAKSAGLDSAKIQGCLNEASSMDQYKKNDQEFAKIAKDAGIKNGGGTPTTVIINTKSGKAEIIAGAYPLEKFQEVITRIAK